MATSRVWVSPTYTCTQTNRYYLYGTYVTGSNTDNGSGILVQRVVMVNGLPVFIAQDNWGDVTRPLTKMAMLDGTSKYYNGLVTEFKVESWNMYTETLPYHYKVGVLKTCTTTPLVTQDTVALEPNSRLYLYGKGVFGNDNDLEIGIPVLRVLNDESGRPVYIAEDSVNPTQTVITKIAFADGRCFSYTGAASVFSLSNLNTYIVVPQYSYKLGLLRSAKAAPANLDLITPIDPCTTGLKRYYIYGNDVYGTTDIDSGTGHPVTAIQRLPDSTPVYISRDYRGGKPLVKMTTLSGQVRTYDNTNNDFSLGKWNTATQDTLSSRKVGVRWSCFARAEVQLRLFTDAIFRNLFNLFGTVEAINSDNQSNTIFAAVLNGLTRTVVAYDISTLPTIGTNYELGKPLPIGKIIYTVTNTTPISGVYSWNNQIYILYATQFVRVNALGQLETVAGKTGQASMRTTPYGSNETDYGYNLTFANLTDICFGAQDQSFYFVDKSQNGIYKLSNEGIVTSLCFGSTNIAITFEDGEVDARTVYIPAPHSITIANDETLYVTSRDYNQIYRLRKAYQADGKEFYMVSVMAGLTVRADSAIRDGETAKYSKPNSPGLTRMGEDGALYFTTVRADTGANTVTRIRMEEYNTYFKGFTGAVRYAPIQVIGNNTTEGDIFTNSAVSNAVSSEFFGMHIVSDLEGNIYYPDPKAGLVYKMNLNNQLVRINESPIMDIFSIAIYNNSTLFVGTESTNNSLLYQISLITTPPTITQIPGTFGSIRCLYAKENGILFYGTTGAVNYILFEDNTDRTPKVLQTVDGNPNAMCMDGNDNLYVTTTGNYVNRISIQERSAVNTSANGVIQSISISSLTGTTTRVVGNGQNAYSGDGGAPAAAAIGQPFGICFITEEDTQKAKSDCLYITTFPTPGTLLVPRIRRVDLTNNRITTHMGQTRSGYPIHGSVTASSTILNPAGICRDPQGNMFLLDCLSDLRARPNAGVADTRSSLLVKLPSKLFFIQEYVYALVGTGVPATAPQTGLALNCNFSNISGLAADFYGNIFFTTGTPNSVFRYDALSEQVTVIAGSSGQAGFSGDGTDARTATLNAPTFIQVTTDGTIYVFDSRNSRIRRLTSLSNGSYLINTFFQTGSTNLVGMAVDVFENVIFSVAGSQTITLVNQYRVSSTLQPNVQIGGLAVYGTTIYFLNSATNRVERFIYPYRTGTNSPYSVVLTNPAGPLTVDANGTLYYITTQNEIRKVDAATDISYVGNSAASDFYDGVLPTAGIKDNRYRSNVLLFQPRAIGMDYFSRLLFSDQQGNRIRCIPTGVQLNECYVAARYILVESEIPGKQFQFSQFDIYTDTNTNIGSSNPFMSPMRTYLYDFGGMKNISYIVCKSGSTDSIGTKVYLLNNNRDILSLRQLTNTCVTSKGETLVYAVPWAKSCSFAEFVKIQQDCGIPNVRFIQLIKEKVSESAVINSLKELVFVTRVLNPTNSQYSLNVQRVQNSNRILFSEPTEILGMFIFRKIGVEDANIVDLQIQVFDTTNVASTPLIQKIVRRLSRERSIYEFVDFRRVSSEFGCSSLDAIYLTALNIYRIRYIRLLKQTMPLLEVAQIVAISQESGENVAAGRPAYTATVPNIPNLTNPRANPYSTTENWIELDLGIAVPLEIVTITPPAGKYYNYFIQCYTETRDLVPIPSSERNPLDNRVQTIRLQGSGYNDAFLQTAGIQTQQVGASYTTPSYSRFTASSYWTGYTATTFPATGWFHNLNPFQREFFEATFSTPITLDRYRFINRTDCCQFRQYGNQLLLYNSVGRLIQRNCLMGKNTGDFIEEFAVAAPKSVSYTFPANKRGIQNVRYVRYTNTAISTNKLQVAQLVVIDVNGINVALNKSINSFSPIETSTVNQILITPSAPTDGSQIPSASKLFRTANTGADQHIEIDLGAPFEIDYVVYYNSTTNPEWSNGSKIMLYDSARNFLGERRLEGGRLRESLDFRPEADVCIRARYVRFENPGILGTGKVPVYNGSALTNPVTLRISNVRLLDHLKRNVAIGKVASAWNVIGGAVSDAEAMKPITTTSDFYVSSTQAGSYWEVDLGQEYSLTELRFKPNGSFQDDYRNTPVTFYDDEHTPVRTHYLGSLVNRDLEFICMLGQNPPEFGSTESLQNNTFIRYPASLTARTNVLGRFVRIEGGNLANIRFELRQVVVLDNHFRNISIGKQTISSETLQSSFNSYTIIDGQAETSRPFPTNKRETYLEIDLGAIYPISAIILYGAANVGSIAIFNNSRGFTIPPVWPPTGSTINTRVNTFVSYQIFTVAESLGGFSTSTNNNNLLLCCAPKQGLGNRARYVRLVKNNGTNSAFFLSQVAVIDSAGRNVAWNKIVSVNTLPNPNAGPTKLVNGVYQSKDDNFYQTDGVYGGLNYNGTVYADIDLGDEYWVTDIVLYVHNSSFEPHNQFAEGITIDLRDTYQNRTRQLTTTAAIHGFTMLYQSEIYNYSSSCPSNTEDIGGTCYTRCQAGEEALFRDGAYRCYMGCGTNQMLYTREGATEMNRTQCLSCDNGYTIESWSESSNGFGCREQCSLKRILENSEWGAAKTYSERDALWCHANCDTTKDGDPAVLINNTTCQTQGYDGWRRVFDVRDNTGKHWEGFRFQAWGINGLVEDHKWWWNDSDIYNIWFDNWLTQKASGRMRRIYTFPRNQPSQKSISKAINTVARQNYVRSTIPKNTTTPTNLANPSTGLPDYDNIMVNNMNVLFRRYFDWTSGANIYVFRDGANPYYVKGRFRAQAFNLLGTTVETTTSVVQSIPTLNRTCPAGFTFDSSQGNCKSNIPGNNWIEINGQYLGPCSSGYRLLNSTDTTCERDCSSYGATYRKVNGQCIDMCNTGFKALNDTKCITDCAQINDSTGRVMEDDSDTLCVTSKPTIISPTWTVNLKKSLITESGQPDKYAWIDINWPEWTRKGWDVIETRCNYDWEWYRDENWLFDLWFTTPKAGISGASGIGRNSYQYALEMERVKWRSGYASIYSDCDYMRDWRIERMSSNPNPKISLKEKIDNMFNTRQFVYTEYSNRTQQDRSPNMRLDTVARPVQSIQRAAFI